MHADGVVVAHHRLRLLEGCSVAVPLLRSERITGVRIAASARDSSVDLAADLLVDASAVAIGDEGFSVRSTDVANLELSDTPTGDAAAPTAVSTVSAFQTNMRAIICERRVSVRIFDVNAVASLTGVQWGPISTDSPMNP